MSAGYAGEISLLYVNGEGPGKFWNDDFSFALGKHINATIYSLEHRYYG